MSSTNPSPQESSSDNDLNDLLALLGSESESPSSTIPSIEDSLVQQLDSFEEVNEQQKTTLPPCQVCGGPSSGYHYGVNTCEACKVFFRRSWTRFQSYCCVSNKKQCIPTKEFRFHCRLCRYNRCLKVGMSKSSIKIGRYSTEKRRFNQSLVKELDKKHMCIPFLPKHSDAQDLIIQCNKSFSILYRIDWEKDMEDFNRKFQNALSFVKTGTFPRQDYVDVYNLTGLELDNRRQFDEFMEPLAMIIITRFFQGVRLLPSLSDLNRDDFILAIAMSRDSVGFASLILEGLTLNEYGYTVKLSDSHVIELKRLDVINMYDEKMIHFEEQLFHRISKTKLSFEEASLITALKILKPNKIYPQFHEIYNRLSLALLRYLESCYGHNYHHRLAEIINLISLLEEKYFLGKKWVEDNYEYCTIFNANYSVKFLVEKNLEESIKMIKSLNI